MVDCKFISLPVNTSPMIRCYRIHGYLMNIMEAVYPDFEKYVISNYLCLHNGKENIRREYLDFHLDNNFLDIKQLFRYNDWFDIIQVHDLNNENYKYSTDIKNLIIEFLEKGYYILHNLNESYLSHTSRYGKPDSNNIVMLYGYNFENDSFIMLDYNSTGDFGPSSVASDEYLNSLANVTVTNRINFIKAKHGLSFEFDFERSLNLLDCYINSKSAYPNHDDYINNIFGYEGVERSLREMQNTGVNLIRMRAIIEHKDVVLRYLKYVMNNHLINEKDFFEKYELLNKINHFIFMKIIKKVLLCKTIPDVAEEFDRIRLLNEQEKSLISQYIEIATSQS